MAKNDLPDKVFIKKLDDILEDNYSREDFGVQELAVKIGLSHTQLHRKIKSEFGKSTSQLIREFRLKKAIILLRENLISAAEVAYNVGFKSPTYFNRCFNNYFGYPPGEARYHTDEEKDFKKEGRKKLSKLKIAGLILLMAVLLTISMYILFERSDAKRLPNETSVAVLPFKILSDDKSNQYFADGVMDDIINHLSSIKELRVISRTTMDQYRETTKTIPEIANELHVLYIIESSIQKYRDSVRLIIQLIDTEHDMHIWSHDFTREFKNLFSLETEIAKKIAVELKATLSPSELERIERAPTENMEAYDLYLQGNYSFNSNDDNNLVEYKNVLHHCLELDPDFAMAYAALARIKIQRMRAGYLPATKKEIESAKTLALKSIEIDDNARGHASLGWLYLWFEWDWEKAEKHFWLAIQNNPNDASGHVYFAEYLFNVKGNFSEARKHIDLAIYLAPYAYYPRSVSSYFYLNEGEISKSIDEVEKMKGIETDNQSAYWKNFLNYIALGKDNMAVDELLTGWDRRIEHTEFIQPVEEAYDKAGIEGVCLWLIENRYGNNTSDYRPYQVARLYSLIGEKEMAVDWLVKSHDVHDSRLPYLMHDPFFKDIRTEPRFMEILEKMRLNK
ncbi:MAG: helix-turn-helix domain-containing protein [Draconibacterium sp.]|nr:helix-turn-helix domain-containing protein [Draconibacterium sp.]